MSEKTIAKVVCIVGLDTPPQMRIYAYFYNVCIRCAVRMPSIPDQIQNSAVPLHDLLRGILCLNQDVTFCISLQGSLRGRQPDTISVEQVVL